MIDSKGQTIKLGDTVEFNSTVDRSLKRGEVWSITEKQTLHWRTNAVKHIQSIRVHHKGEWGETASIFHKSTNLTVVNETSPVN